MSNKLSNIDLITKIAKDIKSLNGATYYVGGFVRDQLINKENKDIDIEIHNIDLETLEHVLEKYGNVNHVGASFGILMIYGYDIDFALPRTEMSTGNKHTDFTVDINPKASLKIAAKRRDFTMNAILQDVLTKEIYDPFDGATDINNKIIKMVSKETFVEDQLRALRAAQFASRLNFKIDPAIIELSKTFNFSNLSPERIIIELNKALLSNTPSIAFKYLREMNILKKIIPELDELFYSEQNELYHAEGNVFNHTMMVIDEAAKLKHSTSNPLFFMYAALFHDIGKPEAQRLQNDNLKSNKHDIIGSKMIPKIFSRLTNNTALIKYVSMMALHHMTMHKITELKPIKLKRLMLISNMNDLYYLNIADELGRIAKIKHKTTFQESYDYIMKQSNNGFGKIKPLILGRDLINLGFTPGPEFKELLNQALEYQLQNKYKSEILTIFNKKLYPPMITGKDLDDVNIPRNSHRKLILMHLYAKQIRSSETDKQALKDELLKYKNGELSL